MPVVEQKYSDTVQAITKSRNSRTAMESSFMKERALAIKRAEHLIEKVEEEERRKDLLMELYRDGIVFVSSDYKILDCNRQFRDMICSNNLNGVDLRTIVSSDSHAFLERLLSNGRKNTSFIDLIAKNSETIHTIAFSRSLRRSSDTGLGTRAVVFTNLNPVKNLKLQRPNNPLDKDVIFVISNSGIVLSTSDSTVGIVRKNECDSVVGNDICDYVHLSDGKNLVSFMETMSSSMRVGVKVKNHMKEEVVKCVADIFEVGCPENCPSKGASSKILVIHGHCI